MAVNGLKSLSVLLAVVVVGNWVLHSGLAPAFSNINNNNETNHQPKQWQLLLKPLTHQCQWRWRWWWWRCCQQHEVAWRSCRDVENGDSNQTMKLLMTMLLGPCSFGWRWNSYQEKMRCHHGCHRFFGFFSSRRAVWKLRGIWIYVYGEM